MTDPAASRNGLIDRMNRGFGKIAGFCFDLRWLVLLACVALFAGSGWIAAGIQGDASYEGYFFAGDTTFQAYESYREDFGSDEVLYIGYEVPDLEYGPWNVKAMEALIRVTEAIEDEVPFLYEVQSLANVEYTLGVEGGIEISKIIDDWPLSQAELLERREAYARKPMIVDGLIDRDAEFGAILLEMDRSSTDAPEDIIAPPEQQPFPEDPEHLENQYPQVSYAKVTEILDRPDYADYRFFLSGDVPINAIFNRILFVEPFVLLGVTVAIISVILLVAFRSVVAVLSPFAVMALTLAGTVAIMATLGYKIGLGFGSTPTLLTAIGVAHSVHILSEFRARFGTGGDRRTALVETMSLVGVPCLLTSVTTSVGFASMSFVPIKSLAQSGIVNGIGVLLAFFFSLTLLMSLLSIEWMWLWRKLMRSDDPEPATAVPTAGSGAGGAWMKKGLDWAAQLNIDHQNKLLGAFSLFLIVFGLGVTRVQVDTNYMKDFWESSALHIDTTKIDSEMGGTTNVIYLFDAREEDAVKNPEVLREIDRLQQLADEEDWLVTNTHSLVDIIKDLNQAFHSDDPAFHRIPDTRQEVAQYLLLYESSGGEEAEEYVSTDYRRANLELRLKMDRTARMQQLVDGLEAEIASDPFEHTDLTLTGIGALWLKLMGYIMSSQIQGFTIAFSVITLVMIAIFRSVKIGLISMVPNLAPVFLALGAMGWLDISLDYNKVTIAAIALGISVDDTIHLMTRFHHEFGVHRNYEKALREAMGDVGRALIVTSLALVLGFAALVFSELRSQAFYGILLSGALVSALIADFFFMPALVLRFKPFGPEEGSLGAAGSAGQGDAYRDAA